MGGSPAAERPALSALKAEDRRGVGPFQVHGRIGTGGMGVVYGATGPEGRWAALKVVRAEYAEDAEFRARFAREIRLMERVQARSIAPLIAAGADDPEPWYATTYVPGPTLVQQVRRDGALPLGQARALAAGMAEAIAGIHAAGVVHRDLKPANVILAPDGPKVIDFGIARALDEAGITRTGGLIGSPGWMSPERFRGLSGPEDDVFAWGALVAYASTGRPPYGQGSAEALMYRVLNEEPDLAGVPSELAGAVHRALAKDPAERPTAERLVREVAWGEDAGADRGEDGATIVATLVARDWGPDAFRSQSASDGPNAGEAPRASTPGEPPPGPRSGPGSAPAARARPGTRRNVKIGAAVLAAVLVGALAFAGVPALIYAASGVPGGGPGPTPTKDTGAGDGPSVALQELREQGFVEAAITNEPPIGFVDGDGEVAGYRAELARAVFAELGVEEIRFESVSRDALLPRVSSGSFDIVAAEMYITPKHCGEAAFATPDIAHLEGVLSSEEDSGTLTDYAAVAEEGAHIGVVWDTSADQYAEDAGISDRKIDGFYSLADALAALESGQVDAVGGDSVMLRWYAEEEGMSGYRMPRGFLPGGIHTPPVSGFALSVENADLAEEIDQVLAEMRADGRMLEIVEPFGLGEEDLAPEGMTTEEACRS